MAKKRAKGQKLDKGESLYSPKLVERVKVIIVKAQLIKANGQLHYGKIATVLGIPSRTFSAWRNPASKYYKPDFAAALARAHKELTEGLDSDKIKRAMIKRAQPYTRIKKTKELQTQGPKMPAFSTMDKKAMLLYAKKLKLKIDKKMTKGVLKIKIQEEIEKQTKEVLVVVKQEEEKMHGDVAAAKFVLPNIGPKKERWVDKQEVDIESQSLVDIIAKVGIGKKRTKK